MHSLIAFVEQTLIPFGALGVLAASFLEQLLPLIPSSLIIFLSGFLFVSPHPLFSGEFLYTLFFGVMVPVTIGGTLGSILFYSISYALGKPVIERFGRYLSVSWSDIEKAEEKLKSSSKDEFAFLAMTTMPLLPTSIPTVLAGVLRYPLKKYLLILAAGFLVRTIVYGTLGAQAGSLYHEHLRYLEILERSMTIVFAVVLVIFLWWLRRSFRK